MTRHLDVPRAHLLRLLAEAGAAGAMSHDLAALTGRDFKGTSQSLTAMAALGLVVNRLRQTPGRPRAKRWWLAEHTAALPPAPTTTRERDAARLQERKQRNYGLKLDPATPAVHPPGLRVTVCPSRRDFRFSVRPGEPLTLGLHADWQRRRAGAQASSTD